MVKPEWGQKRQCQSCGARFYDMLRSPIHCPKCGVVFEPEAQLKSRRVRAEPKGAAKAKAVIAPELVDDVEVEEADAEIEELEDDPEVEEIDAVVDDVLAEDADEDVKIASEDDLIDIDEDGDEVPEADELLEDAEDLEDEDVAEVIDADLDDEDDQR